MKKRSQPIKQPVYKRQAQAALEFLMTYGGVLLVVGVVVGGLAFFGVFKMFFAPETCIIEEAGMVCEEFKVSSATQTVQLKLRNGFGKTLTGVTVTAMVGGVACGTTSGTTIESGSASILTIPCEGLLLSGERTEVTFQVTYSAGTQLSHTAAGSILAVPEGIFLAGNGTNITVTNQTNLTITNQTNITIPTLNQTNITVTNQTNMTLNMTNITIPPINATNLTITNQTNVTIPPVNATTIGGCTDTDGGLNFYIAGSLSGEDNYGNIISQTDVCLTNGNELVEKVCTETSYKWHAHWCPNGCANGACKGEPAPGEHDTDKPCSDTDGGKDYFVKGKLGGNTASGSEIIQFDQCGFDGKIFEKFCTGDNTWSYEEYHCENGCLDGACKPIQTDCTETDEGKDYTKKGITVGLEYLYWARPPYTTSIPITGVDKCFNSATLLEYYCKDNLKEAEYYTCPNGCANAVCKEKPSQPETVCTDSDGGPDYFVRGTTTGEASINNPTIITGTDTCLNIANYIREYYCFNDIRATRYYNCPKGCNNGVCL